MYLKLDKKLILEVEEIVLESKKSTVKSSVDDILKNISKFEIFLKVFQKIDIEKLKIKDNEFTITLNKEHLYLDNKYINISADLDISSSQIFLDIYSMYLKDLELILIGKSKIDLSKRVLHFFGTYEYSYVEGEINAQLTEEYFDFYLNTTKSIKSLKFLKKLFRIDKVAEVWMYDNVTGDMNLNYLSGKIDLKNEKVIMNSIKGEAVINDAKIKFNKEAKTVNTKKLLVTYKKDRLSFDLEKPIYNKSKIYGSRVYITDLTSFEKGTVFVDLKTKSMLNSDILEILKAYEIELPLKQKSGKLDSSLLLKIPYLASKKMKINGSFKATNAVLMLNNFEFIAEKANIILKDNELIIKNSHILHKDMINANLELTIDTKKSLAKGKAKINSFEIKDEKDSIVNIKDIDTDLNIDFKDNTKIDIKALKTKLEIQKDFIDIDIASLKTIFSYSNLLKTTGIGNGDLKLRVFDENHINFFVNAKSLDFPFEKDGEKITTLSANGTIKNDSIKIKTNNDDIEIILKKDSNPFLKLKNTDLVLYSSLEKSEQKREFPNIDLQLKNSIIKLDREHQYEIVWANIHIKDSKVFFEAEALNLDLPISKNGKRVTSLIGYGTYENGIFDIKTKDNNLKLKYEILKEKITMNLKNYDILYNTNQESQQNLKYSFYINGTNSNIIINKNHIAKADKYKFIFERNNKTDIDLQYKSTSFKYNKDFAGHIAINAMNMNDTFLNALFSKQLIKDGSINLYAMGKDSIVNGNVFIKNSKIVDLAILNNLIILINSSPGLINPLLAIPSVIGMAAKDGFNLNGYRVVEGKVDFRYDFNNKFLNMHKIKTKGNGIDFEGFTTINFNNSIVDAKLKLIFFKDYSSIVGMIPVFNYILLGDEKRVDTEVSISGTLTEPKYKTNLTKETISVPINLLKRVIMSPIELIKSVGKLGEDKKEVQKDKKENE